MAQIHQARREAAKPSVSTRLVRASIVMLTASAFMMVGTGVANAAVTKYANQVYRSENERIQSARATLKGGQVMLHMDLGDFVNATPYGQLKKGNGSTSQTILNYTGSRKNLAGGSLAVGQSSTYNSAWWDFPGGIVLQKFPLTGANVT